MRSLLVGASLLALAIAATPAARAQQPEVPGTFLVYFDLGRSTLTADGRQVVRDAAAEYRRTGAARLAVTGHADSSGDADSNLALSERRVETVRGELVRLGVPDSAVAAVAQGEDVPLVETADGVRESRNRRVEIAVPQPTMAQAEPPPPPAEPRRVEPPPPPPEPEPEKPDRFTFSLGPVYGHNFKERDGDDDKDETESDLVGAELVFNALPGFLGGLSLKQSVLYGFNSEDDGLAGRSVLSLDFAPDLGFVRPRLSLNGGYLYGAGVQDGFVAGPELALDLNLIPGFTLRPKVAYDYQFRNSDWDEGVLWGGLDLGIRF